MYSAFIVIIITVLLSGCTLSEMFTTGAELRGEIQGRTYIAPDERFRVVSPRMQDGQLSIRESSPAAGVLEVYFEDNLCRRFVVSEQVDVHKGLTLDEWVDRRLLGGLERQGLKVQERNAVQLKQGPAVFLGYPSPHGAPCSTVVNRNGRKEETVPDADVGVYVLRGNGFIYQLMYILGRDPAKGNPALAPRGPLEEQLRTFSEGFETALKTTTLPRIP